MPDNKNKLIIYAGVIDAKGVSQAELYLRMKAFYNTYRASENAIQLETDESGRLSGRAFSDVIVNDGTTTEKQRLWYTLAVELQDGKFNYEFKDFILQRHCIPARAIPCEVQTQPVAIESILIPAKKSSRKNTPTNPYSPENALEKATNAVLAAMKNSVLTESRIASAQPE